MSVIWLFNSPEESDCSLEVIIGILLSQALSSLPQGIKTKKNKSCIYNRLLLNILYVINQKYGLNL